MKRLVEFYLTSAWLVMTAALVMAFVRRRRRERERIERLRDLAESLRNQQQCGG